MKEYATSGHYRRQKDESSEPPHDVSGEMRWCARFPTLIDVVAHFFDELRHKVRTNRLVPAALDFHTCRTKISGITADAGESRAMKGALEIVAV